MTQQKDLRILRITTGPKDDPDYEYQLFKKGQSCKTHKSKIDYPVGIVHENRLDGSITLTMKEIMSITFTEVEDDEVFVVTVERVKSI